jgi:ubiquinone/menaquinone biosynthesis C-methylase UbiE
MSARAYQPSPKFWDRVAERYAKKPVADEATYQKKLAVTRGYFRPDMKVLELGCGTGSTAIVHAPHVAHIRAIDISKNMIEIAQGKAEAAQVDNVAFEVGTIEQLSVPDESVDVVLALSFLHLLKDKEAAIAKFYDMLVPGGLFVSSTACLGDSMKFFKYIAPIGKLFGRFPLVKVFGVEHLKECVTRAGFEIDYEWQPGKNKGVFIVAKKPA